MPNEHPADAASDRTIATARPPYLRFLLVAAVVVAVIVAADQLDLRETMQPERLRELGAEPTLTLLALFGLFWLAQIGGSAVAISAVTVVFGWIAGTWISVLYALIAHSTWFWLARTSLRPFIEARAGPRVQWVMGAIERGGVGLVVAWNVLGGPGPPFLFAAALSKLPYRIFALGVLCIAPRALMTAIIVDTFLRWETADVPDERWLLIAGVGVPMAITYSALMAVKPELRPWRFGEEPAPAPDPDI